MADVAGQGQQAAAVGDRREAGDGHSRRAVDIDHAVIVADGDGGQALHPPRPALEPGAQPRVEAVEHVARGEAIADRQGRSRYDEVHGAGAGAGLVDVEPIVEIQEAIAAQPGRRRNSVQPSRVPLPERGEPAAAGRGGALLRLLQPDGGQAVQTASPAGGGPCPGASQRSDPGNRPGSERRPPPSKTGKEMSEAMAGPVWGR
jgi:hypothetical protein